VDAKCAANVRTWPKTSATIKKVLLKGAIVTVSATVTGGWWSTDCGTGSHGYSWLKIVAINGKSTTSLFGRSAVYAAKGLFTYGPNPTPTPETDPDSHANTDDRPRADRGRHSRADRRSHCGADGRPAANLRLQLLGPAARDGIHECQHDLDHRHQHRRDRADDRQGRFVDC
jgi:hypothetical protein